MLFNSYIFILIFLPITLFGFFTIYRVGGQRAAIGWMVLVSLFFYGWWNPAYVSLILASILVNYHLGTILSNEKRPATTRKAVFIAGITANLLILAYYKYANFFLESLNIVLGTGYSFAEIILPLGISFFTFTQIAFLVDAYRGEVREYNLLHYALFVTYFPHLIAGPVLHHKEMMPQFAHKSIFRFDTLNFSVGLTYFIFGLFKKVILADGIASFSSPVFTAAMNGQSLSYLDAWGGALSFTFQLYFDFSGYSDMAIGLALMIGIRLPINFNSPYKAVNIIEFWRRWHMTLSRFLRDYLYFSLGGNKKGKIRRYLNLMITMLLGGLWHGAGWTYIIWGGLHGFYLIVNHGWQALCQKLGLELKSFPWWWRGVSTFLTFIAVVVGWVYFRSGDVTTAHYILEKMASVPELRLSPFYSELVLNSSLAKWIDLAGIQISAEMLLIIAITAVAGGAFFAPNTQEIMGQYYLQPRGHLRAPPVSGLKSYWSPQLNWAFLVSLIAVCSLLGLTQVSEFLYFQF